jgi:methionine synthase II (cobalamin-independent)
MMDYYGSIIQSKEQIYKQIISHYPKYNVDYITQKLDSLYESGYLSEEISVSGWNVFIGPEVVKIINTEIKKDLELSKQRLKAVYLLKDELSPDIIYNLCLNLH